MNKPILIERFADTGEHSHWELIDENGYVLWSENTAVFSIIDSLARQNFAYRTVMNDLDELVLTIKNYIITFDKVYSPAIAHALTKGYIFPQNAMLQIENELLKVINLCTKLNNQ